MDKFPLYYKRNQQSVQRKKVCLQKKDGKDCPKRHHDKRMNSINYQMKNRINNKKEKAKQS